ncbi:MAG: SDR family oxidoreductase [Methanobacteriaceae archaeon]|nr:SDR family oxidoreductase [Methanobacteriaceae archaeon]
MSKKKVALVTGGASGLGRTIVEEFLKLDYNVVFTYLNSEKKAQEVVDKYSDSVYAIKADAVNYEESSSVIKKAIKKFGEIDVLVNNAASARDGSIGTITYDDWDYTIKNVLYSCFNYTNEITRHFIKNKKGKIINIGSINGLRGREGSVSYCSAKAAIIGLTKTIAKELGAYEITANVVAPGFINTAAQANTNQLIKKMVLEECAIKRLTEPLEVANLVVFLASEKANNITGQVYQIDCGQYM